MPLRLGALQDALLDAGASPETAKNAAEELANYERQLADVRSDLTLLKWMVGFVTAVCLGNLWLSFTILSRLPR
jgi:hypothetical protein